MNNNKLPSVSGISMSKIMATLNDENIPNPTEYKKQFCNYVNVNAKHKIWRQETIKNILSNPTYIGNMTQGKSTKINYKVNKFKKIPKSSWIITENTHAPIISKEIFEIVQNMLSKNASYTYQTRAEHLFSGLV